MIVRPAQKEDTEAAVALLHGKMNSKLSLERWRGIFDYDWNMPKPNYGYVAEADGRIVGYLGAVHSERALPEGRLKLTNMCAWYVEKEYRGSAGLLLMMKATADPERHYTSMTSTSNPRTMAALRACGFASLDDYRWDWQRRDAGSDVLTVITDPAEMEPHLRAHEKRYVRDMLRYGVRPVLMQHPEGESFAMFSVTKKGADQPWWDVLYIRTPKDGFLTQFGQDIANKLLPSDDAVLSADQRFCGGQPLDGTRIKLPAPRFVKSKSLNGPELDHLYTELQLLSLKLD